MFKKINLKQLILLLVVGLIFFGLRFYNLHNRVIFDWDQERDAKQVWDLLVNFKPTLIGPRVFGPTGFFLGPYYTYLLAPFFAITKLHPSALICFLIFYNLLFFFGSYYFLKKVFNFETALFFLLFWATNPLLIHYDTLAWNPLLIPFGVILIIFLLSDLKRNFIKIPPLFKFFFLGLANGLFFNFHFQFIFILIMAIVYLILERKSLGLNVIKILSFLVGLLIPFLPLVFFDLRHQFLNSRAFINLFFNNSSGMPKDYNVWQFVLAVFLKPLIFYQNQYLALLFLSFTIILSFALSRRTSRNQSLLSAFFTVLVITPVIFILYAKRPSEYYFVYFYPLFYIILTQVLNKGKFLFFLAILLTILNRNLIYSYLKSHQAGLAKKEEIVLLVRKLAKGKKFIVSYDGAPNAGTGFDYLFTWYKNDVKINNKDPLFQINLPPKKNDLIVGLYGVTVPKEFKQNGKNNFSD